MSSIRSGSLALEMCPACASGIVYLVRDLASALAALAAAATYLAAFGPMFGWMQPQVGFAIFLISSGSCVVALLVRGIIPGHNHGWGA